MLATCVCFLWLENDTTADGSLETAERLASGKPDQRFDAGTERIDATRFGDPSHWKRTAYWR